MHQVLIVEDSSVMRDAYMSWIEAMEGFEIVDAVPDGSRINSIVKERAVDLIVMDVCPYDHGSGFSYADVIKQHFPDIKILLTVLIPNDGFYERAATIGCEGVCCKTDGYEAFRNAISVVAGGGHCNTPSDRKAVALGATTSDKLTSQELSILEQMVEGRSYQEIAESLYISINTVKSHIKSLHAKTGMHTSIQVAVEAVRQRLIR